MYTCVPVEVDPAERDAGHLDAADVGEPRQRVAEFLLARVVRHEARRRAVVPLADAVVALAKK